MENLLSRQLGQQQTQIQTQTLTPAQLQGLDLLVKPLPEIETLLAKELADNPLLEVLSPGRETLAGDTYGTAAAAGVAADASELENSPEDMPFAELSLNDDYFAEGSSGDPDFDEFRQKNIDLNIAANQSGDSLTDLLYEQMQNAGLDPELHNALETLIGKLDENGFLRTHPADIAMCENISMELLNEALKILQSFDPPGIGARNGVESLILQLKRLNYPDERIYTLLTCYQDDLARNKLPQIARNMHISMDTLYKFLDDLKKLNTVPAAGLTEAQDNQVIVPEMTIELENDEIKVIGCENYIPKLGVVRKYLKMLQDPALDDETLKYLKEKLLSAETLIAALAKRQDTLRGITLAIARKQADYFRYGEEFLKPMTRVEVAEELEIDESTVSRAVGTEKNGLKYLDTPQGLKEYRFFFTAGVKNQEGDDLSSRAVKARIRDLIESENPAKPYSDAALADMLAAEGVDIARRTVAKYRESMNIPATNLRRRHR